MNSKVTKLKISYPKGQEPNFSIPVNYEHCRYALGKTGENPLVAICMNPSAADDKTSDKTANKIINASIQLNYDGWIIFNVYPERATNSKNIEMYNEELSMKNLEIIKNYLTENSITEVWGAWGNLNGKALKKGKMDILKLLKELDIKVFHFAETTKNGEPRHPVPRIGTLETILENKRYFEF